MSFLRKMLVAACCVVALASCSDDVTPTFSQKNLVRCDLMCLQYPELFNAVGNYGQYVTIRLKATDILLNGTPYTITAEQSRYFALGLGGLIVGTNYDSDLRAYDLACPNCDRADRRLSIADNGIAQCPGPNCRIKYDLNHDGVIVEKPEGCAHSTPRGLYRYRVTYDGQYVHIYN